MDDGLVVSTNLMWIQWVFDVLISLFEGFGISNNVVKTVSMV